MESTRQLAAIMFTDMVGSTASAQANEAEALRQRDEQANMLRPLFSLHRGREVKSLGDGFLVQFDSALNAVECAIEIQEQLGRRNARAGDSPIRVRIGVHLGDVEQREADIFGDAVNIAARVEGVADPGGICVSGAVQQQVQNKITNPFEKLPPTPLKGVKVPVDLYRLILDRSGPEMRPAPGGHTGIAVLPFSNISPDSRDEYFAEGLTEELISAISHLRDLRVISRTSVMQYRATKKPASQIGTELGVSYLLEGSVRKAGDRLRITAQLIDAVSDRHLWAQSYDRLLDDVLTVQAEIANEVASGLKAELGGAPGSVVVSRPPVRTESYLAYLRGRNMMHGYDRESIEGARKEFELAISTDPRNGAAHAGLADALRFRGSWEDSTPGAAWDEQSRRLLLRANELDPNLPEAHASLGLVHFDDWKWSAAEQEFRSALSLNPSYALAHNWLGMLLEQEGRAEEAVAEFTLAEGADPLWSVNLGQLAILLTWLDRLDEARLKLRKMAEISPDDEFHHIALATYHRARSDLRSFADEMERVIQLEADAFAVQLSRAYLHAVKREEREARSLLPDAESSADKHRYSVMVASAYAELGDLDHCFSWLELGVRTRSVSLESFRLSSTMASVKRDQRFLRLLERMHLG